MWSSGGAAGTLLVGVSLVLAIVSAPAHEHLERGYVWLTQARLEPAGPARERLLTEAIEALKEAYQNAGPGTQVRALVGAAQAYLLVQSPRRVFPFLWQATPLQRAERNLQQALFLQPDNAAAALLLGMVYWRQSTSAAASQDDTPARSRHYLERAASLGIPVRLPTATTPATGPAPTLSVDDRLLALQYVDVRGSGTADDLVLLYQPARHPQVFGVLVAAGQTHPLIADTTTGALAPASLVQALTVTPRSGQTPVLTLRLQHDARQVERHFTWDGTRVVPLPALP